MSVTIDETIGRIEQLYALLTGKQPPQPSGTGPRSPADRDASEYVDEQMRRLVQALTALPRPGATPPTSLPRVVVSRDEEALQIAIDLPGTTRDEVTVRLDGGVLKIRVVNKRGDTSQIPVTS